MFSYQQRIRVGFAGGEDKLILRAVLWAYSGAVLAGLIIGVAGFFLELPPQQVVAIAPYLGIAAGTIGFGLGCLRGRVLSRHS